MTSRIITVASWNETHNGALRIPADSGFVIIVGTNVIYRARIEDAEKFARAVEPLTDEEIAQSL